MESTAENLIEIHNLKKTYRSGTVSAEALRGIDLTVKKGEYLGIVGKSGAGKTTLLNMIAGLDNLTEGEISVGGQRVDTPDYLCCSSYSYRKLHGTWL